MPALHKAYSTYKNIDLTANTAERSPSELIVMIYDALCANLRGASLILEQNQLQSSDWEERVSSTESFYRSTSKALELVTVLQELLDFEKGEPLASQLSATYESIRSSIWKASQEKCLPDLVSLLTACSELRSAWKTLSEQESITRTD